MGQVFRILFYRSIFLLSLFMLSISLAWGQGADQVDKGRKIFIEKRCYTCHTVNAQSDVIEKEIAEFAKARGVEVKEEDDEDEDGDEDEKEKRGGDLSHVGKVRDTKWISEFIQDPKGYFKEEPECAREARKKQRKRFRGAKEDLDALVAYLSSLKYEEQQAKGFKSCLKE